MELLFAAASLFVLPFWLLMIGLPGWQFTRKAMESAWVVTPLLGLYAVLLAFQLPALERLVTDPTLPGLAQVLGGEGAALVAWVHFLAFDLFVGRWEFLDGLERGYHPLMMAPVLWATLLVGPLGLLLYLVLRTAVGKLPGSG